MLIVTPASVSAEAQLKEVVVIVGGFVAMLLIDLALLRRAFAPLRAADDGDARRRAAASRAAASRSTATTPRSSS